MTALFLGKEFAAHKTTAGDFGKLMEIGRHPLIVFTEEQMTGLMELHSLILSRFKKLNDPYPEQSIEMLVQAMLLEIAAIGNKGKMESPHVPTRQESITGEFFKVLRDNFTENRSVAFYADKLCYAPKYLSAVVKKTTGYTVQEWINEIVVLHAKSLLKTTDMTVLQISEELHFSNPSFFGRFFKQYTGMTPMEFRFS